MPRYQMIVLATSEGKKKDSKIDAGIWFRIKIMIAFALSWESHRARSEQTINEGAAKWQLQLEMRTH